VHMTAPETASTAVLLVEDERIFALDLSERLALYGYRVCTAANAEDALALIRTERIDVVLMDIHIEGEVDGIALSRIVREEFSTPVVFLTAYADDSVMLRAAGCGPFGYLLKPCQEYEVHAALRMALLRSETETSLRRERERLRHALEATGFRLWEWDTATGILSTDDGPQESQCDECDEDWAAPSTTQLLYSVIPDDRLSFVDLHQATLQAGGMLERFVRYERQGQSAGTLEMQTRTVRQVDGSTRLLGLVRDATSHQSQLEGLRRAAAITETVLEGVLILDAAFVIRATNPAFTVITGFSAAEVVGQPIARLLRDGQPAWDALGWTEAHDEHRSGEAHYMTRDGRGFPVWQNIGRVRDPLNHQVTAYVVAITNISALRQAQSRLAYVSYHDVLTGLPNRVLLAENIDDAIQPEAPNERPFALLCIDIDGFKLVNETLGHAAGDQLLQQTSRRLALAIRPMDVAARTGGDEFAVLTREISEPEDAALLARELLAALHAPMDIEGQTLRVSASIGIAMWPEDGRTRPELMRAADTALHSAKENGKNRYCFHTIEMAREVEERLSIEIGLRQALDDDALQVHYQPQIDVPTGRVRGVEALVRWPSQGQPAISPQQFIPVAEATGLIVSLGRWVLQRACTELLPWIREGRGDRTLAVNVSVRQIMQGDFHEVLSEVLQSTGFPAHQLEIEITESTVQALEHNLPRIQRIKDLGVQVVIDDFGTGYSSLSVIKHMPIDCLKIDRSFVRDTPGDRAATTLVRTILIMAQELGLRAVAEGVETREQLAMLRALNCDMAQGFLFGKGMPLEELLDRFGSGQGSGL